MFDQISSRYDLLNHLLSLNIDKLWRKRAVKYLQGFRPHTILDVATGTGDFALAAASIKPQKITGIDLSEEMLKIGNRKIAKKGLSSLISLMKGDSEALPFPDNSFDAAIVAFGVRNFENPDKSMKEILRVINPGGVFIVLEFSKPAATPFKQLYNFYFSTILPFTGRIISGDENAYSYLHDSVNDFPYGDNFISILKSAGYENCHHFPQTMGIAAIYISQKPKIGK